ncbi:cell division protein FtsQ/DivIB [Rheinheimera maricola]|uniref:Cell division protein FtsQ n=1 Tax=Rheinheimera maricola TaxID=2793282 RepID=A0ABS7X873_9GAMM|nr:cell division protein FtsQ/DivIB [Rheinheimera maricola]MBZ9611360.1 cell division protein FtsQ/DivIB [Rheinheimera maricola]
MNGRWPATQFKQRPAFYAGVVFFIAALLMLIWAGVKVSDWVHSQQSAPVRQVRLYGDFQHINASALQQTLQQQYVGNFFSVNVDQVQQFLLQQPWVYQVAVRKQWPDALVVVVTEQQPVAIWNQQQLLNTQGEIFHAPLQQLKTELPMLTGPEGSQQDALTMFRHMQGLLALHKFNAVTLGLTERFSWQLSLSNGIALKLGRENTLKRLQRFIELYPVISKHKAEAVAEVDLRYDTGIAVRYSAEQKRKA